MLVLQFQKIVHQDFQDRYTSSDTFHKAAFYAQDAYSNQECRVQSITAPSFHLETLALQDPHSAQT